MLAKQALSPLSYNLFDGIRTKKGGCGDNMIYIFKSIPASAAPFESVNSHSTKKQSDGLLFSFVEMLPSILTFPLP